MPAQRQRAREEAPTLGDKTAVVGGLHFAQIAEHLETLGQCIARLPAAQRQFERFQVDASLHQPIEGWKSADDRRVPHRADVLSLQIRRCGTAKERAVDAIRLTTELLVGNHGIQVVVPE